MCLVFRKPCALHCNLFSSLNSVVLEDNDRLARLDSTQPRFCAVVLKEFVLRGVTHFAAALLSFGNKSHRALEWLFYWVVTTQFRVSRTTKIASLASCLLVKIAGLGWFIVLELTGFINSVLNACFRLLQVRLTFFYFVFGGQVKLLYTLLCSWVPCKIACLCGQTFRALCARYQGRNCDLG